MAFHPYPRVIPSVFNRSGFGPPRGLTPASACPWVAHPASRPRRATRVAVLKTRFRCGSLHSLTSPRIVTRWLILQKARRHTVKRCSDCSWARGFRRCFTPLSGCFSPFPHGTGSLSVTGECSALEGGPPGFGPGFTCPALLGILVSGPHGFAYGALTLFRRPSQAVPLDGWFVTAAEGCGPRLPRPTTPARKRPHACTRAGLGWPGFARRYSRDLG